MSAEEMIAKARLTARNMDSFSPLQRSESVRDARALLSVLADELEAALAREQSVQRTNETLANDLAEAKAAIRSLGESIERVTRERVAEETAHAATKTRLDVVKKAAQDFALAVEMAREIDWADAATYEAFCEARAVLHEALKKAQGGHSPA